MDDQICPIFGTPANVDHDGQNDIFSVTSQRAGGEYIIFGDVLAVMDNWDDTLKIKLARWIYEQNQLGEVPKINSDMLERIAHRPYLSAAQKADVLFKFIAKKHDKLGESIGWVYKNQITERLPSEALAATESSLEKNSNFGDESQEIVYLFDYLCEDRRLYLGIYDDYHISPHGHNLLDGSTVTETKQAFVAMWFNDEVNDAYVKAIEPAIRGAGYSPLRIDKKEHNNKIDDEIISEIRKSKFVIADFTSGYEGETLIARGGVYYEAGFAHGLGLPVIWTCHEDCIEHVHFDTRQYNHIVWKTPDQLYEKLKNRIEATIT